MNTTPESPAKRKDELPENKETLPKESTPEAVQAKAESDLQQRADHTELLVNTTKESEAALLETRRGPGFMERAKHLLNNTVIGRTAKLGAAVVLAPYYITTSLVKSLTFMAGWDIFKEEPEPPKKGPKKDWKSKLAFLKYTGTGFEGKTKDIMTEALTAEAGLKGLERDKQVAFHNKLAQDHELRDAILTNEFGNAAVEQSQRNVVQTHVTRRKQELEGHKAIDAAQEAALTEQDPSKREGHIERLIDHIERIATLKGKGANGHRKLIAELIEVGKGNINDRRADYIRKELDKLKYDGVEDPDIQAAIAAQDGRASKHWNSENKEDVERLMEEQGTLRKQLFSADNYALLLANETDSLDPEETISIMVANAALQKSLTQGKVEKATIEAWIEALEDIDDEAEDGDETALAAIKRLDASHGGVANVIAGLEKIAAADSDKKRAQAVREFREPPLGINPGAAYMSAENGSNPGSAFANTLPLE